MSYSKSTPNFKLPDWMLSDKPSWFADVAPAFGVIDGQMYANQQAAAAANALAQSAKTDISAIDTSLSTLTTQVDTIHDIAETAQTTAASALTTANAADAKAQQALDEISGAKIIYGRLVTINSFQLFPTYFPFFNIGPAISNYWANPSFILPNTYTPVKSLKLLLFNLPNYSQISVSMVYNGVPNNVQGEIENDGSVILTSSDNIIESNLQIFAPSILINIT